LLKRIAEYKRIPVADLLQPCNKGVLGSQPTPAQLTSTRAREPKWEQRSINA
jgi:hypothetical protein